VVAAFPNVTAINIGEVLSSFARVLDRLSLAIRAVAVFLSVGRRVGDGGRFGRHAVSTTV
jgi:predicted lysophospholipase L1 biosynthesis ABC-type transport system permease subunit